MGLAIINLSNQEEIIADLNNQIFNCLTPKSHAQGRWIEMEDMIAGGIEEHTAYSYLIQWINEHNRLRGIDEPV